MIHTKNQERNFDLERAGLRLTEKIALRAVAPPGGQAKILADIEVSEARLYEEIGRLKRRFTALDAAVEEIKRHRSLVTSGSHGRVTKSA